ncbi:GAF and ANTAR domain-containing protein [Kitasatospora sp. NPDC004745]|uniref:GAF and ANTAR domain-containing protein n=1 Tax=unclassified Kitasatospora TaxID=2633591 RepID=UPI0033C22D57
MAERGRSLAWRGEEVGHDARGPRERGVRRAHRDADRAGLRHRRVPAPAHRGLHGLSGAAGAGLVVADRHGTLRDIAYSSDRVRRLEALQIAAGEGPCLDCHRTGETVVEADLDAARSRWPRFVPRALDLGFRSVRALPLRLGGRTVGALNVFDDRPGADPARNGQDGRDGPDVVQPLADLALLHRRYGREQTATEEISAALVDRSAVERAKGVLAEAGGLDMDTAFEVLRSHARRSGTGLADAARALVDGHVDPAVVLAG